jgi:hypothetical protein
LWSPTIKVQILVAIIVVEKEFIVFENSYKM